jgi:hypothetical protein
MRFIYSVFLIVLSPAFAAFHVLRADDLGETDPLRFRLAEFSYPEGTQGNDVALGDFNGDGTLDAIIAFDNSFSVLTGDGTGTFSEAYSREIQRGRTIQLLDFDEDDALDAVINGVLWKNDGTGKLFKGKAILKGAKGPRFHDLDRDGHLDVVTQDKLKVHWNRADGQFIGKRLPIDQGGHILGVADFDGDELADVLVRRGQVEFIVFNGGGQFDQFMKVQRLRYNDPVGKKATTDARANVAGPQSRVCIFADLDGDKDADVVSVRGGFDTSLPSLFLRNEGDGQFKVTQALGNGGNWYSPAKHADFDRDGDFDIIIGACFGDNTIWINDGKGGFAASSCRVGSNAHAMDVGDIDGDGDEDIFTVGCEQPMVWINELDGVTSQAGR